MTTITAQSISDGLGGRRSCTGYAGFTANCPVCNGKHKLSINDGHTGKPVVHCYVCGKDGSGAIITALSSMELWHLADDSKEYTPAELEQIRNDKAVLEAKRLKNDQNISYAQARAAKLADTFYQATVPATDDNPYLAKKAVKAVHSLRQIESGQLFKLLGYYPTGKDGKLKGGMILVVPIEVNGKLASIEMIDNAGGKSALTGGKKAGGYWLAQEMLDGDGDGLTLAIGEGVSTVLSVKEATDWHVVSCLSCSNFDAVAKQFRRRYPKAEIVILADLGNGQSAAEAAAKAINGRIAIPDFGADRPGKATDFNDMACSFGLDKVKGLLEQIVAPIGANGGSDSVVEPIGSKAAKFNLADASEDIQTLRGALAAIRPQGMACNNALCIGLFLRDYADQETKVALAREWDRANKYFLSDLGLTGAETILENDSFKKHEGMADTVNIEFIFDLARQSGWRAPEEAEFAAMEEAAAEQDRFNELLSSCETDPTAAFNPELIELLLKWSTEHSQEGAATYQAAVNQLKSYGIKKGDISEALKAEKIRQDGITQDAQIKELNRQIDEKNAKLAKLKKDDSPYQVIEWERGFRNGTYFFGVDDKGVPKEPEMFCGPLFVSARTRNGESSSWGALLRWPDLDKKSHSWAMPAELLAGGGEEYRAVLLDGGLEILPGTSARYHLGVYIQSARTEKMAICTTATGWHDGVFVFPHKVIGKASTEEEIIFQSPTAGASHYQEKGTLADWRDNVSVLCRGNSRLMFSACVAFASTMLEIVGNENGGFHHVGDSSTGKSTALMIAASVFGGSKFVSSWRSTINGLEGIAAGHNGALLILDELAQCNPKDAGETAYMLANGEGKQRANRSGLAKNRQRWRLLFLSSGEIDLTQHMREAGKRSRAGQEVRLVSIPVAGAHGIFDKLHDMPNGKAMSDQVKAQCERYHGTAGIAFIEWLAANMAAIPDEVKAMQGVFIKKYVTADADGQVQRVAGRFALCAIAGEMATEQGITGWATGEAMTAAGDCLKAWVDHRGGTGKSEVEAILSQARAFFESHGSSRFEDKVGHGEQRIINRAGFYEDQPDGNRTFYMLGEVFKNELCQGYSEKTVKAVLIDAGMLRPGKDGKPAQNVRLPGLAAPKVYVFHFGD